MPARNIKRRGRADFYKHGDNNIICDRSGFKLKASMAKQEWNGLYVDKKLWEERHPMDFLRGLPDRQRPAVSRPGTPDYFIETSEVKVEDL